MISNDNDNILTDFLSVNGKPTASGKRVLRELERLNNDVTVNITSAILDNKDIIVKLFDLNYNINNMYIFNISSYYPFRAPLVSIYDDIERNICSYSDFLRIKNDDLKKFIKQTNKMDCLCCHSFLCSDRWTPHITISNFIDEIRIFRSYKRNFLNKIFANVVKRKYLIDDIDLNQWLF